MQTLYYPVTVDILENHLPPVITVKQCDTARGVAVTLTARGEPYEIPQNATFMLRVRRPDKQPAVMDAELRSNIIYAELTPAALAEAGNAVADIAIYDTDGKLISTFLFFLHITGAAVDSKEITASPDFDALAKLLTDLMRTEQARQAAEAARATEEAARVQAESQRAANEAARNTAEAARAKTEAARSTAEEKRQAAETARASAENSRTTAETARAAAEDTRATEEAARVQAESQRAANETARSTAEAARAQTETERAAAEATRSANEQARTSAENSRTTAETARAAAEDTRESQEAARAQAEAARAAEYASFMETYGEAYKLMQEAAASAAEIKNIYSKMQITLFFDETGGICYTENVTK